MTLLSERSTGQGPGLPGAEALIGEARSRQRHPRAAVLTAAAVAIAGAITGLSASGTKAPLNGTAVRNRPPNGLSVANLAAFRGEGELAFISQGRLFALDGATDSLTALTPPTREVSDPQFAPNGRWLTYSLDTGAIWLARAPAGTPGRSRVAGSSSWLPSGELDLNNTLYTVASDGALRRVGSAPGGLIAWAPGGHEYVFATSSLTVRQPASSKGTERIETATSLFGPRTLWYEAPVSFTPRNGLHGNFVEHVTVLPNNEGLLLSVDPDQSDSADGTPLFELDSPGAPLVKLAVTLNPGAGGDVSFGAEGTIFVGGGGDRYAWSNKSVDRCDAKLERCTRVPTPSGELSLDPTSSPDGRTLAFVEAPAEPEGAIGQAVVARWYATHHLYLLASAARSASEVAGTAGATTPIWSNNARSLLYVAGDALWLVRAVGSPPVEVAAPLFSPGAWPSYYGEVDWSDQFAWWTA